MAVKKNDPTAPIRLKASRYPGVDEGTACTQSSFKAGKKAFLFVGMQGGRYKVMLKLQKSIPEATKLAREDPDRYGVGSAGWATARFTDDKPMPKKLWEKWLDESYKLSLAAGTGRKAAKKKIPKKKTSKAIAAGKAEHKTRRK